MKSKKLKIIAICSFTLLAFFQNCSGGFQVIPGNLNSANSVTANIAAQCSYPDSVAKVLSQTCFGTSVQPLLNGQATFPNLFEYEPQYPGYSDGATKRRWIYIPQGTAINTQDLDNWVFPVGTVIFKEFSVGGIKIETRLLEKLTSGTGTNAWRFSNYAWTTDQTDAELVTGDFYSADPSELARFSAAPIQSQFKISLPNQCMSCHAGAKDVVNGFDYLQLSSNSIKFNITQASQAGLLSNAPTTFDSIQGSDLDKQAIGYIQTNCAICHGPNGPGTGNFRHSYKSTSLSNEIFMITSSSLSLIVNGNPDTSLLYQKFSSGAMPRVAPVNQDVNGVSLIRTWISDLQ